ncbi:MAG TPA: response regulator [Chitinophagaceae bacterium]|nr:response regulator [Chitinophagaceae bacterium]
MDKAKLFFIVDDDADDIDFFSDALREVDPSIKCVSATNGEEALQKLKAWTGPLPDFIILDLNLPRMNGKKCLTEIKKTEILNGIPVVIYSTATEKNIIEEMKTLGAAYFISKPNRLSVLRDAIRHLLSFN